MQPFNKMATTKQEKAFVVLEFASTNNIVNVQWNYRTKFMKDLIETAYLVG